MSKVCFEVWIEKLTRDEKIELQNEYLETKIADFKKKYKVGSNTCMRLFGQKKTVKSSYKKDIYGPIHNRIAQLREKQGVQVIESAMLPGYSLKMRK